jgi:hypothetical protein
MNSFGYNTFTITSEPYYDPLQQQYKNILTINVIPKGPLKNFVTRLRNNRPIYNNNRQPLPIYKLVLINIPHGNDIRPIAFNTSKIDCGSYLMTPNEIPDLITFLQSNNYQIETQITKMINQSDIKMYNQKVLFTVTYFGTQQPNICYMK